MFTRSQKSFANDCEVTNTSLTKGKTKTAKMDIQAPIIVHNDETENIQLPVFNIHVHVPPMTIDSDKINQFQPVIHLHFGDLVNKLSSGTTLENGESIDQKSEVKISSEKKCNFKEQSNSHKNITLKPVKKNNTHRKLSISRSKKNSANLKTENSEVVLNSIPNIERNEETPRNSFSKKQFPARRSIRIANNRKLIKRLKELSGSESITTETKKNKVCENIKIENVSSSSEKTFNLKEPMVVLYDISQILEKENSSFYDDMIGDKQTDSLNSVNVNAWESGSSKKCEKHSYDSLDEIKNEQNSLGNEENEKNLQNTTNDQDVIPVSKRLGEIYSFVYSSDSETSSTSNDETDFIEKSAFCENSKVNIKNAVDPEKSFCKAPLNMENTFVKDAENNQVINNVLLQPEAHKMTETKNDLSNVLSKDKDQSLNLKKNDIKNGVTVSLNLESKGSGGSSDKESNLEDPISDLIQTTNFEEDIHQSASLKVLCTEKDNVRLQSKNNNLLKGIIEENTLSSSESDNCKGVNENTLDFQLKLIKKEMKKRDMIVKEGSRRTKSLKKETASQITKEIPEKSTVAKKKLSKRMAKSKPAANSAENLPSVEDYIPLEASGPTKFAVAQLSNVKPYNSHKSKNFKNEMLFGKRVNRYSNPKQLQIYLLKKQAARLRNK